MSSLNSLQNVLAKLSIQVPDKYRITDLDLADLPIMPLAIGGYGSVYRCIYHSKTVCVKKLNKDDFQKDIDHDFFISEIAILARLSHPNIIGLIGYTSPPTPSIVIEWALGCDLSEFIHDRKLLPTLSGDEILRVTLEIAKGLKYLHKQGVLHCDFKANNIMFNYLRSSIKLIDFGLSCMRNDQVCINMEMTRVLVAPRRRVKYWYAPEQIRRDRTLPKARYTDKSDMFSYGIVIFELVTGSYPYNVDEIQRFGIDQSVNMMINRLINNNVKMNEKLPKHAYLRLIFKIMQLNPYDRMSSSEACRYIETMIANYSSTPRSLMMFDDSTDESYDEPLMCDISTGVGLTPVEVKACNKDLQAYFNMEYFRDRAAKPNIVADTNPLRVAALSRGAGVCGNKGGVPFRPANLNMRNPLYKSSVDLSKFGEEKLRDKWKNNLREKVIVGRSVDEGRSKSVAPVMKKRDERGRDSSLVSRFRKMLRNCRKCVN